MAVTGLNKPDFRTIAAFRARHLPALLALFGQVLALCAKAGLVQLGHVAVDGTKIKANASRHKAMSYGRMGSAETATTPPTPNLSRKEERSESRAPDGRLYRLSAFNTETLARPSGLSPALP